MVLFAMETPRDIQPDASLLNGVCLSGYKDRVGQLKELRLWYHSKSVSP